MPAEVVLGASGDLLFEACQGVARDEEVAPDAERRLVRVGARRPGCRWPRRRPPPRAARRERVASRGGHLGHVEVHDLGTRGVGLGDGAYEALLVDRAAGDALEGALRLAEEARALRQGEGGAHGDDGLEERAARRGVVGEADPRDGPVRHADPVAAEVVRRRPRSAGAGERAEKRPDVAVHELLLVAGDEAPGMGEGEGDVHRPGTDAHLGPARASTVTGDALEGAGEDGFVGGDGHRELRGSARRGRSSAARESSRRWRARPSVRR